MGVRFLPEVPLGSERGHPRAVDIDGPGYEHPRHHTPGSLGTTPLKCEVTGGVGAAGFTLASSLGTRGGPLIPWSGRRPRGGGGERTRGAVGEGRCNLRSVGLPLPFPAPRGNTRLVRGGGGCEPSVTASVTSSVAFPATRILVTET